MGTLLKLLKLFRSSGKGIGGVSKTVVGLVIIVLGSAGLDWAADVVKGQEVEISVAVKQLIEAAGVLLALFGTLSKQQALSSGK